MTEFTKPYFTSQCLGPRIIVTKNFSMIAHSRASESDQTTLKSPVMLVKPGNYLASHFTQ